MQNQKKQHEEPFMQWLTRHDRRTKRVNEYFEKVIALSEMRKNRIQPELGKNFI